MRKLIPVLLIVVMVAALIGTAYLAFPPKGDTVLFTMSKRVDYTEEGPRIDSEYLFVNRKGEYCTMIGTDRRGYKTVLRTILSEEDAQRLRDGEIFDFVFVSDGIYLKSWDAIKCRKNVDVLSNDTKKREVSLGDAIPEGTSWEIKGRTSDDEIVTIAYFSHDESWILDDSNARSLLKQAIINWDFSEKDYDMLKAISKVV